MNTDINTRSLHTGKLTEQPCSGPFTRNIMTHGHTPRDTDEDTDINTQSEKLQMSSITKQSRTVKTSIYKIVNTVV